MFVGRVTTCSSTMRTCRTMFYRYLHPAASTRRFDLRNPLSARNRMPSWMAGCTRHQEGCTSLQACTGLQRVFDKCSIRRIWMFGVTLRTPHSFTSSCTGVACLSSNLSQHANPPLLTTAASVSPFTFSFRPAFSVSLCLSLHFSSVHAILY